MDRKVALLLEDDAIIALDVATTLEEEEFAVVVLDSVEDALQWLAGNPAPAIAVVDVILKDGSCEPVAKILAERNIAHVIHSAVLKEERALFPNGVWLPKPTSTADLKAALRLAAA